ncbi:putative leucine-rich repeat receptor-like protein kinase isoform X2 [Cinnamomum micranthum f. kanehirae]|uniref:Putative leucine-rich repeat receptor-like protein kinase isoform X2 n=1 Tax=Cinnamomum micranthum f. kanehirae TaxID=337451 RepID=A0A443N6N4_9MAGN|nr:putative leucine-rich repeat receptor-like protein kinase isoform X2 [Cinnamomum micranthum f. kanehirae]
MFRTAFFIVSICCCSFYWCHGCLEEERTLLLQIKDSISYPGGSSLDEYWVGKNCCQWYRVDCNPSSSRVISIKLGSIREERLGLWYPNTSLFAAFKELEKLYLWGNHIGGWVMPQAFSEMQSLRELHLSSNNLSVSIDSLRCICELTTLRVLNLDMNRLNDHTIPKCLGNLSLLEELSLSGNELKGNLPGLCELRNIRELNLDFNNLDGRAVPPCLSNLSKLETLSLSGNDLGSYSSALTGICELTALRGLYLSENRLDDRGIPKCMGNLSLLEELYLLGNELKSPFSSLTGFCELRNLQNLNVANNSYVGSIPQCFGNMNSLRELHISYNQFTGANPSSIFQNLTNLMIISASDNQFNDSISFSTFANLSKLVHIDLSDNVRLEVEMEHPHWVPTFQLQSLFLSNCILNRRGGSGIPTFISTQQSLETLDLSHSFLKGTIPSWLLNNLTVSSLILGGNSLKGTFPQSTRRNNSMLNEFDVSDNFIYGELPSNIDTLFPNLIVFNMSKNKLQGTIPASISKLQTLRMLDLAENNLFGEMPHGLTRNNTSLEYLRLSNNKLQGNILSKFSNMTELVVLLLDSNGFTGTIASNILSSPSLKILDLSKNHLSGFIPSWLPLLMNLAILHLDWNFFNGPIPSEFCQMQNLHILDLSNNKISGSIPSCLPNISSWMKEISIDVDVLSEQVYLRVLYSLNSSYYVDVFHTRVTTILTTKGMTLTYEGLPLSLMTIIDFSMNQLTGNIPSQMGHLKALHSLNLSNNILSGPIPESFQNLESIESLDLSHNKIVGTIPPQMVQLYKLSAFNVSSNNLSGAIPNEKQFLTFNESSYTANPHLCGPPLQRSCSCNNSSQPRDNKGEEEEEDDSTILDSPLFFYLWVAIAYILGFWGFIALFANKNWRWKFFSTVDRCFDCSYLNLHMFGLYLKNFCCN